MPRHGFKARDRKGIVLADEEMSPPSSRDGGHLHAFAHLVQWVRGEFRGELAPVAVGHRVVHGGLEFVEPTLLTDSVIEKLDRLVPLVPLHQPHNLASDSGRFRSLRPDLPQVACFDTAFHHGRAAVTERFALPDEPVSDAAWRLGFSWALVRIDRRAARETPQYHGDGDHRITWGAARACAR